MLRRSVTHSSSFGNASNQTSRWQRNRGLTIKRRRRCASRDSGRLFFWSAAQPNAPRTAQVSAAQARVEASAAPCLARGAAAFSLERVASLLFKFPKTTEGTTNSRHDIAASGQVLDDKRSFVSADCLSLAQCPLSAPEAETQTAKQTAKHLNACKHEIKHAQREACRETNREHSFRCPFLFTSVRSHQSRTELDERCPTFSTPHDAKRRVW